MIVSSNQFVFIHVPKNAGTSIEKALLSWDRNLPPGTPLTDEERKQYQVYTDWDSQHWPLSRIEQERPETIGWKSFGIVSHPFRRAVSEFSYIRKTQPKVVEKNPCFKEWDIDYAVRKGILWKCCWAWHALPQSKFFEGEGNPKVFRLEKLKWQEILDYLGIEDEPELPRANQSSGKRRWEDVLSTEAQDVLYQRFRDDFAKWNY